MDFYQFNYLPNDARADLVWQHGRYLAVRDYMGCTVPLYHVYDFFAEVGQLPPSKASVE
jgi:hypothetical protein